MLLRLIWALAVPLLAMPGFCADTGNTTYTNPILPGWNSDPSCTFVPEWDNTFFCTTSSFLAFPGIPVYASKDLVNWRLASNGLTRPEQLPELTNQGEQNEGIWASTLRYRDGVFYLITGYVTLRTWGPKLLLFTTTDPYDDGAWSDPVRVDNPRNDIDPDIFWDHGGKIYMAIAAGIYIHELDIETGAVTEPFIVWNGTGDRNPEGPHLYHKDNYYYLLIGEGGTETNHTATLARSNDVRGPYEGDPSNPILTNKNTDAYFQTVGHADFFQDAAGNWWAVALATRSGPEWEKYPMGRELVLVPMTWPEGDWPVLDQVRGEMSGPLPPQNLDVPGAGHWVDSTDVVDFHPGSSLPKHFSFWQPPHAELFKISPRGHPNTLRISASRANLTANPDFDAAVEGQGFVFRRQSATVFHCSVDLSFNPQQEEEEAGVTVFLTQFQHIDLGIVGIKKHGSRRVDPTLRFRVEASGKPGVEVPETAQVAIPQRWLDKPIRLSVYATEEGYYILSAVSTRGYDEPIEVGKASSLIVSGGTGPFSGK
jgi:beta-xylosidase